MNVNEKTFMLFFSKCCFSFFVELISPKMLVSELFFSTCVTNMN